MDLWTFFIGFLLGVIEGVTEFLPVSSTGHLILAGDLLGFNDNRAKTFEIAIQLGAILAILWLYRDRIRENISGLSLSRAARNFWLNLGIAFVPAAAVGFLAHKWIKAYLFNPVTVAAALVAGGIAILVIERLVRPGTTSEVENVTPGQALKIGAAQCLALFPGVSRAGATIMGGLVFGLSRKAATEFSFFLAIPTMFAAVGYDLFKNRGALSASDLPLFAVGFVTAFVSALVVVRAFVGFVSRRDFTPFAVYRIVFGLLVLAYYGMRGWAF